MSDELLPDIPNVIHVLEDMLQDIRDEEDYTKVPKKDIVSNIENILDMIIMIGKYVVAEAYKLDILDRAIARKLTNDEDDDDEVEMDAETAKKILSTSLPGHDMFA